MSQTDMKCTYICVPIYVNKLKHGEFIISSVGDIMALIFETFVINFLKYAFSEMGLEPKRATSP